MKKYFLITLFFSLYLQAQAVDLSSQLLLNQFELARSKAIEILSNFKACHLAAHTPIETRLWLDKNIQSLIKDLQQTPFFTVADEQPTCAYTVHLPMQPLFVSVPSCFKGSISQDRLIHTLIHETSHHLGVSSESEADKIAVAVLSAQANNCTNNENIFDVYDPKVCEGKNFTIEKIKKIFQNQIKSAQNQNVNNILVSKKIGHLDLFIRVRDCDELGFCQSWQNANLMTFQSQKLNARKTPLLETKIHYQKDLMRNNEIIFSDILPFEKVGSNWNYVFHTQGGVDLNSFQISSIKIVPYSMTGTFSFYYQFNENDQVQFLPEEHLEFRYFKTLENCSWGMNQQRINLKNKTREIQIVVYGKNELGPE